MGVDRVWLILRSTLDPSTLAPAIRSTVASIDPGIPVLDVHTYDDLISQKFVTRRLCAFLVTLFSGAALFLSSIGLYGILAYSVGQRTREIGIRITLGAQIADILRLIAGQGVKIVGVGLSVGFNWSSNRCAPDRRPLVRRLAARLAIAWNQCPRSWSSSSGCLSASSIEGSAYQADRSAPGMRSRFTTEPESPRRSQILKRSGRHSFSVNFVPP